MSKCVIDELDIRDLKPVKSGGSSKGGQEKYFKDGIWYKKDSVGFESVAEVLSSRIVRMTNANLVPVDYDMVYIKSALGTRHGCKSTSFLSKFDIECTVARALEKELGTRYRSNRFPVGEELLAEIIALFDGFKEPQKLKDQLSCLLQLDRLVLNVDRHLHNIILRIQKNGNADIVSFDYGDSLASDITYDFYEALTCRECIEKAVARPFSGSYDTQCKMLQQFSSFTLAATSRRLLVTDVMEFLPEYIFSRMLQIIELNFKKYLGCDIDFD